MSACQVGVPRNGQSVIVKGCRRGMSKIGESILLTIAFRKVQCFEAGIPVAPYAVVQFCDVAEKPPNEQNCLPASSCESLLTVIC